MKKDALQTMIARALFEFWQFSGPRDKAVYSVSRCNRLEAQELLEKGL